jgi:hypothetical protein
MKYKLPKKFESLPCYLENYSYNLKNSITQTKVLNIDMYTINSSRKYVYDLTVEDNHNYFANDVLVHNCSGTFTLERIKKKWFWQKDSFDFGVSSRNLRLWNETNTSYWFVANKYKLKEVLMRLIGDNDWVCIQGECIGPQVQGNKYKVNEPDFYAFNLIYPSGKVCDIMMERILGNLGIKICPLVEIDFVLPDTVNEILNYATAKSKLYDTLREGIVLRNYEKNISFKSVSPEFLIKNDE